MIPAQPFVRPDEPEDVRVERVERGRFAVHHVTVEVGRTAHRLTGVVDDEVEPITGGEYVVAEGLDARRVTEVESEHLESVAPLGEVRLGGIPRRGVTREAGGDDERSTASQQFDARLVADLHPPAREQCDRAGEVGEF